MSWRFSFTRCPCPSVYMFVCLFVRLSVAREICKFIRYVAASGGEFYLVFLPRDAMQARPMSSCGVCLCVRVCLSVTFLNSVKTNKRVFKNFPPSSSQAILVFPHQTSWQYSDGNLPNEGVEFRWCRQKSRF